MPRSNARGGASAPPDLANRYYQCRLKCIDLGLYSEPLGYGRYSLVYRSSGGSVDKENTSLTLEKLEDCLARQEEKRR